MKTIKLKTLITEEQYDYIASNLKTVQASARVGKLINVYNTSNTFKKYKAKVISPPKIIDSMDAKSTWDQHRIIICRVLIISDTSGNTDTKDKFIGQELNVWYSGLSDEWHTAHDRNAKVIKLINKG